MWQKLKILFLFGIMISSNLSCTKQIDEEQFHNRLIDLHTFYHNYYKSFANESSTAEELEKWERDFYTRKKSDLKTLNQMMNSEFDNDLCHWFKAIINHIEVNSEHLYKEIITTKSKQVLDGEDISKLNRFYRDTKKYYLDKESLFMDLYYKFIRRHELEINEEIHNLK